MNDKLPKFCEDINPKTYNGCALDLNENDQRLKEFQKQRFEKGFDDTEIWNLDYVIAKFIAPKLKRFLEKSQKIQSPENLWLSLEEKEEIKKYYNDLNRLIEFFENYEISWINNEKEQYINEMITLFAKHFTSLWI